MLEDIMRFTFRKMARKRGSARPEAPIGLYSNDVFTSVLISPEEDTKWGASISRMSQKQLCGRILKRQRSAQLGNFLNGHPEISENYSPDVS